MKKFLVFLAAFVFILGCGEHNSSETTTSRIISDEDSDSDDNDIEISDTDTSDIEISDEDSDTGDTDEPGKKQGELYGRCYPNKTCNEGLVCDEENDICIKEPKNDSETPDEDSEDIDISDEDSDNPETPDETPDTDTPANPEAAENHKISGVFQAGSATTVTLTECGKTEKIAEANTDTKGKFSFKADISDAKTYCVKAGDFASCFKGASDHTANISEITTAAYLLDKNCADLRKSETKIRTYAKLGTGEWLGELDYSKLSGISEGLKLLSSFIGSNDAKTLSEKIAEDAKKDAPEFAKLFNGFKISADKTEIIIGESTDSNANFSIEGGSTKVAPGFKITWTLKNKSAEAATYKFTTSTPGEYTARAKLDSDSGDPIMRGNNDGGDPIMLSSDSATVLFLQRKNGGTVYVSDTSKNISFRIDDGIYGVIPKGTVVKKNGSKINSISYDVLTAGGNQISRLKFRPEGAVFEGDTMYFVHELGTVFGGDPIMLSATRTNADGSVDVMNSAAGDPIMMAAAGDPIMTTAAGDPIMQAAAGDPIMTSAAGDPIMTAAAGDPIMTSAAGDPIMTSAAGDPIMNAAAGDPIMTSAAGDPIMAAAAGDPIMMGTSSSTMVSQTNHYSTFTVEAASLPVSVDALLARWCDGSYYHGFSPIEFIKEGVDKYKPAGDDKTNLMTYLDCATFGDLGNDLYELINKPVGFQRNLNLIENLFFTTEFHNRMLAKHDGTGFSGFVAVKNGLELRSAIAALYTATTSYNRSSNLADLFDPSMIPLTYSGITPKDYTTKAKTAILGDSNAAERYAATKKEMMIFANYITTSSKGPDFSSVEALLTPDQLICAWMNPETPAQNCNKIYTLNEAGHVALGGTEVTVAEANAVFTKYFMPMNSRLSNDEKLDLFRTFYLALKYAGTIFYNGSDIEELRENLLETAYLVFDGINANANAVTITDTFDASAHTVSVLDGAEMATVPYLTKLSALTDKISLKVAAASADVEKLLISIEGYEFDKVQENTRTYYKPKSTSNLKEKSVILTPGTIAQGEKALKTLLGSENVDELGSIIGKMTIVANSKISGKTYTTQKTYDFFVNDDGDGVNSKPVPANIQIFVNDSNGQAIASNANPTVILNPGNKVFYAENGMVSITDLAPAAYTIDAFADGYYAKNVSVNVPSGATFGVEIRLDEELTSTADANLELNININTVKHPSKVYIQIYNDDMDLVANEAAKFIDAENTYETLSIALNSGRYTLLAVGEDMYRYLEAITLYAGNNEKTITVVAKNACGNGIVDSAEECEPSVEGSTLEVLCGEIYPASTYPEKTAACDPMSCTFNKTECGKAALCGDGIIDKPSEACDGGSKACAEIEGFGNSTGSAPCASDCSGYITANNCSKTTAECGTLPANALWNDGVGRFAQTYNGENWLPAAKSATFGTTKEECVFSCAKGYKWNGSICEQYPLSLALICTGATDCFDNTEETECPAYGVAFFGQDAQYAAAGFCTPHTFTTSGSGNKKTVTDSFTHYEWQAASSSAMTWDQAEAACSSYEQENGGSTAVWRLPNPDELLTIIDSGTASPALGDIFTANGHTFWATEDAKQNGNAWRVDENGELTSVAKATTNSVICVRIRDYDTEENRFTAASETVKDSVSGLMWQKQAVASRTWAEALNYCEEVSTADKFDWRLPNRNELASLIDYTRANGAASNFPAIAAKGFWTSTSSLSGNEAWTVDFESGSITSADKTDTKYIICVRNDEPCLGGECADPCSFNACRNDGNSTGLCSANDYSFTCGCKSGFNWNHGKCLLATTRYIACVGLPENAVWNTVFGISQSYDGNKWYPSETGTFNKIASNTECRFICATNYKWDADEEKCLPVSRMAQCADKTPYSDWNSVSRISQTWDGEKWVPSSESVYNQVPSEEECRFICKEHYTWDSENKICDGETRENEPCIGLPANAHWWNDPATVKQKWTNGAWAPSASASYNDALVENQCFFGCNENYEWKDTSCVAKKQNINCDGLPDNAEWTGGFSSIDQTWNGSEWVPSNIGSYNTESNSAYCRYKCLANYNWNGSTCVAATQIAGCTGLIANAQWNTVSSITQTYMEISENTYDWSPSNVGSYGDATMTECHFTCKENYEWTKTGNSPETWECVGKKQTVECAGLPANAQWKEGQSTVEQQWNGTQGWLPAAIGQHNAATGCSFECSDNYTWNASSKSCVGATRNNQECTGLKEHAHWNGSVTISQTWSGSAWLPETTGTYGTTAVNNQCRFSCNTNYTWTGSTCEPATQIAGCGTLPPNTVWNTVSSITQTWDEDSGSWLPKAIDELYYSEDASTDRCRFKCADKYRWNGSACIGATRNDQECTGLIANAEWWNGVSMISQTWNDSEWAPSTVGSYSASADPAKCLFKCKTNYKWDTETSSCVGESNSVNCDSNTLAENAHWLNASITQTYNGSEWVPSTTGHHRSVDQNGCSFECNDNFTWDGTKCAGTKQIANCTGNPANSQWNTASSIEQTWTNKDGSFIWWPSNTGSYGAATTSECHFICKENYEWQNSECVGRKQNVECVGLPANAKWQEGHATVEQQWSGSQGWLPSAVGSYKAATGCSFECNTNYDWANGECTGHTNSNVECDNNSLPANAQWWNATINQTWNGSEWLPTRTGSYSTSSAENQCRYKCKDNYTWNGASCVAATQIESCTGLVANAQWNTVSSITQTWTQKDDGSFSWYPSNVGAYGEATTSECHFTCKENYEWLNNECSGIKKNVECVGLPANATWQEGHSTVEQQWNGSQGWIPAAVGDHNVSTGCSFECNENYTWNSSTKTCDGAKRNDQECSGLVENAEWTGSSTITQTWNGFEWTPSLEGSYNETPVANQCRFRCRTNYKWSGSSCDAATRITVCGNGNPPAHAVWNTVSSITQKWNGSEWVPDTVLGYSTEASTDSCRFKCADNYTWNDSDCIGASRQDQECTGLVANAEWWNATITQTWNDSEWVPSTVGSYSASADNTRCFFKCKENYKWDSSTSSCIGESNSVNCDSSTLAENAHWLNASITQTYNGSEWVPSTTGHHRSVDQGGCSFECNDNFAWDGTKCAGTKQIASCTGLQANSQWNTVSSIEQTWTNKDGSFIWYPSNTGSYGAATTSECHFTCKENYEWINNECVGRKQTVECVGLPANAAWQPGHSTVEQQWNGSQGWLPSALGSHNADTGCSFECNDNYAWNASSKSCDGAKRNDQQCTGLPKNADWTGSSTISQTWNGSAWLPELNGTYGETAVTDQCYFKCRNNYSWNGSTCVAKTQIATCGNGTLPPHAVWNTVSSITQTWDGEKWVPEAALSHSDTAATDRCFYKCAENYIWNDTECIGASKEEQECTGLVANAEWWNGVSKITQRWNDSEWTPSTAGQYSESGTNNTNECIFKCKQNYKWNQNTSSCVGATSETPVDCDENTIPANAHWVEGHAAVTQTWTLLDESTGEYGWLPTTTGHHKSVDQGGCSYECNDNFIWDDTEADVKLKCRAAKQIATCIVSANNAQGHTVSIEQTWTKKDDGTFSWWPDNISSYSESPVANRCTFKCQENYVWKQSTENPEIMDCFAQENEVACTGLPANAHWLAGHSTVEQTWNGVSWEPSSVGQHDALGLTGCLFECDTDFYTWDGTSACIGKTIENQNCTGKPESAEWNIVSQISQRWNGSSWVPSLEASYNVTQSETECRFKCPENHNWTGTVCEPRTQFVSCGTLPANATWNTVSQIRQTWTDGSWEPAVDLQYSAVSSETECRYVCKENYEPENENDPKTACVASTRNTACTSLPANAQWNSVDGTVEQTWNGSAWAPAATGVHGDETTGCYFKCIDENDKYEWKNNACAAMTRTGQACTDKPENAHWNDHDQISQTWNGEMWFPSTSGTYSTSTDATKCYFSCDDNYTWNGSECVAAKRIKECSGLAANAQWNTVSSIEQTYQGNNVWSPSNTGSYGAATTTECHYKCNDNYEWKENPENSAVMGCFGKTQTAVECIGLPANAHWLEGHSTVDQTWNGTQGWLPAAVGHHDEPGNEGCLFECDTNYEWKNGACTGVTRTEQPCTGLADDPANNASWNSASAISQTWNGTEWLPTTVGTYNETTSTTQCRFKCNDNYEWNGSACVGATKLADCEGKPEHSIWNTVSRITQTYNGTEYAPATKAEHCNSTTNCCFECLENYTYHYDETTETSTCEPATRERACEGLPANAVWRTSAETTGDSLSITQRWNGSDWEQSTTGVHGSYIEGYCRFACIDENTHYQWIDNSCVAMTRTGQTCTDKVANSHWNDNGQISQTWNGTEWFPPTTGSYSTASDPARCYFSCDENYEWYYDECVGAGRVTVCEGLPANAAWNTVSYITQRYNGSVYEPSATASYCNGESSYTNCCFKCLANYTISNDKKSCEPNTRTRSCTGLPANAQWNTSMADGQIIQTWSGSEWIPELTGTFVGQDAPAANSCIFKCAENYEWKGNLCAAKTEVAQCKGLPANAIWNEVASIVRTWQGDDWDLSDRGIYSEETSKTECRFKCKENYTWNGSKCKADKRVMDCKQRPANSVWNIVSTITQTWNGSEWLPKLEPEYIPVPSENECRYTCDTGFYHVNGKCVADPCNVDGVNPCSDIANTNSEHTCKKVDNLLLPYSCECADGFHWWGKAGCRQQAVTLGNICTGLDKCYDGDTETVCPPKGELFYGQDAQYADMGYCAPKKLELKETIVGSETITTIIDKNTGLEWLSETQTGSWSAAVEYCNNLNTSNYAGHNDWRLPSIKELVTLISYNLSASMIEEDLFGNWNYAWSSTEDSGNSTKALELGLSAGTVYPDYKTWAGSSFTCVRGDELPENDFTSTNVNGEIVIKDENTNLYWQKNYGELIPDWRRALAYCENLVYGGYDDWRVPNINELLSIVDYTVDYTQSMPTINPIFDMPEFEYGDTSYLEAVSSTTGVQNVKYYRSVDFANGHSSTTEKLYVGVLHCVRSDQCDGDLVWTGKECVDNPCGENSCTMENSNRICKPLSSSRFECGCVDGYIWDDSSESCIKDSCSECTTMRGSDGTCTRIDNTKFECGCTEDYFWSISSCRKKAALGSICTGQTQCYSRTGEITCPAEGEDYYGQDATYAAKGACLEKSFTPATFSGEEVVIDNNTGIMWQKYASSEEYTHYQAVSYCADLEYAGYTDWRLPNVVELYSIMDFGEFFMGYGRQEVAIDTDYFPAFTDLFYRMWSSVSNPNSSAQARYVWYYHEPQFTHYLPKTDKRYFRCVRGNAMAESKLISWTKNDNEILVDTESGLMFNPTPNWMAWDMALNYCETSNYAGYTDWRLPNINEARLYKGTMSSTRYYLAPDDTDKIYHSEYNGLGLGTETIEDYAFDSEIHCVRSGNVPKDFPINEGEEDINMTCGEIVECENNCYLRFPYDNENRENRDYCLTSCYDESIKNARYLHDDLHTCFNENDSSCWGGGSSFARSHCLASACETELAACFANSGEGPHCTESYDVCYSSESVDSTTDCMGLSQCMDSCGEDYNCRLACQFYTTNDAQRDYDEITWYSEQCANAVDFEGCMIGFGYYYVSSYESCYGVEIDTTCSELSSCIDQCKGNETCKQQCRNNASEAGNYRYDNFQQCIADNCAVYEGDDEAYEECIDDNCWREGRICFAESSKIYSCSNLDWCINNCSDGDQVCENNCRKYTTSEGETQYDDLQQCYDEYHDFCISDSDPDGCLRAACRPQYNTCYDIKELNCFELDECRSKCTGMDCIEACNDRASLEAKAQYDNAIDCLLNNCQDFFGTEDFNNCRDTYCGQYEACWDDGCEDGYFWNGSACVIDPCSPNPCGEHSNGVCTATDQDQYSCGCDSGYFWSGSACVDPCNPNPCSSDPNSTGCIAIGATEYTCECQEGYIGINSKCKVPETLWNFEDAGDTTFSEAGNSSQYHWERMTTLGGYSGSYAMCSNNYNVDSSNAVMTITVNMPQDGSASFYIKGSGEKYHGSDFDYFTLYLDGDYSADILLTSYKTAPSDSTNGWSDWTPKSVRLTAGVHTLKFLYQKNSSDYQGDDRFCIDDLSIGYGSVSGSISSCYELMQCYGTCGEGEAYCFSACDNNSTSEAQTQYNDMLTCYAANCMSASAEDFYDCMSTNCPTESANCF